MASSSCIDALPCLVGRSRATGELVNEADLDWPNIAEEIESVDRSETRACESYLVQALLYDLKAEA